MVSTPNVDTAMLHVASYLPLTINGNTAIKTDLMKYN